MSQSTSLDGTITRRRMRQRIADWFSIWGEIPERFGDFLVWVFVAIVIGGVFPLVRIWTGVGWHQAVVGGTLSSFCVILLSDSIAWNVILQTRRATKVLEEGRRVMGTFALVLVIAQAFLVAPSATSDSAVAIQLAITLAALFAAIHLHCFRLRELEPTVGEVLASEEASVEQLKTDSDKLGRTKAGETL